MNLSKKMSSLLPLKAVSLLKKIGRVSNSAGYPAFVVGGLVRDLILGVRNLDLDIVVEGDAIRLGHSLAAKLGTSIVVHKKFGTCSLITKDRMKIDLATARKEVYEKPASLPVVEFSSLKDDLIRRDFTVNAMAVSINPSSFGRLIDFFGGRADIGRGRIKVMHEGSFIDDPTRIFRAVRFESRFGFAMDERTEELIKNALDLSMFEEVEPQRIRDELISILKEPDPLRALRRMSELDELRFIHPEIRLDSDIIRLCGAIESCCGWYDKSRFRKRALDKWLMYLMALFEYLTYGQVSAICNKFVFRGSETLRILSCKRHAAHLMGVLGSGAMMKPSRIYRLLEPMSFESILFVMARAALIKTKSRGDAVRSRITDFLSFYNGTRTRITGSDIKAMGLKPSPDFGRMLKEVLYGRIDGRLKTKKDELAYVGRLIKARRGG
jgi:tRNA nucleotidyltransferase (CCA-adding enzyme)